MKAKSIVKLLCIALSVILFSCMHKAEIPAQPEISFSTQVQPVLVANCTMSGCHSSGSTGGEDLFALSTYNDVMSRNLVVAGNANSSRLFQAITASGENQMPPKSPLSNDNTLLIYLWIEQGAKNN